MSLDAVNGDEAMCDAKTSGVPQSDSCATENPGAAPGASSTPPAEAAGPETGRCHNLGFLIRLIQKVKCASVRPPEE